MRHAPPYLSDHATGTVVAKPIHGPTWSSCGDVASVRRDLYPSGPTCTPPIPRPGGYKWKRHVWPAARRVGGFGADLYPVADTTVPG
jgi:hypothetical protein